MANSERLYKDKKNNMFVPMNVEGGSWNEHFMTTPKLIVLALIIFVTVALIAWLRGRYASVSAYVIILGIDIFISQLLIRYIIFEEKFYYKMYKQLKQSEITTPAIFWDIASIKETEEGVILTYTDGKIGILIKIERDTIIGKNTDFREQHYDAISDFYKELAEKRYHFVQMNIMEQAGNDPRLMELDKLVYKSDNQNINKLMEKQIGHIKNITHRTLYESDYILVYTKDLTKMDDIINDALDCLYKLLDGAFIGYRILKSRDIIEFIKEEYGVKYFNITEATISMFKNHGIVTKKPFELSEIIFTTGEVQKLGVRELNIINNITSEVLKGTIDINKTSLKDAVYLNKDKTKFDGIDFESLSEGFDMVNSVNSKQKGNAAEFTKNKKSDNPKGNEVSGDEKLRNSQVNKIDMHSSNAVEKSNDNSNNKVQQNSGKYVGSLDNFNDEGENIDF